MVSSEILKCVRALFGACMKLENRSANKQKNKSGQRVDLGSETKVR